MIKLLSPPSVSPARPVSGDQDQEAALATLDSLETDFHESVSAVGSREGSTVQLHRVHSQQPHPGRKKTREDVITDIEATHSETDAVAAGDKEADAFGVN